MSLRPNAIDSFAKKKTLVDAEAAACRLPPSFRFLDEQFDGFFIERNGIAGKTIKRHTGRAPAIKVALIRKSVSLIVVRDTAFMPIELV